MLPPNWGQLSSITAATHSPFMLSQSRIRMLHVRRPKGGGIALSEVGIDVSGGLDTDLALDVFGLVKSNLWDLTRLFIFVEGLQDRAVLMSLIGDAIRDAGARIIVLGGGKHAAAPAAEMFDAMTNALSLVVIDNLASVEIRGLWDLRPRGRT